MLRLAADENFTNDILRGVLRLNARIDMAGRRLKVVVAGDRDTDEGKFLVTVMEENP